MQSLVDFWKSGEKTEYARHSFATYSSRNLLTSNNCYKNCRVEVDNRSFAQLLPGFCGQVVCEERFEIRKQRSGCRTVTISEPTLRTNFS